MGADSLEVSSGISSWFQESHRSSDPFPGRFLGRKQLSAPGHTPHTGVTVRAGHFWGIGVCRGFLQEPRGKAPFDGPVGFRTLAPPPEDTLRQAKAAQIIRRLQTPYANWADPKGAAFEPGTWAAGTGLPTVSPLPAPEIPSPLASPPRSPYQSLSWLSISPPERGSGRRWQTVPPPPRPGPQKVPPSPLSRSQRRGAGRTLNKNRKLD